jgi:predicted NBD/HSP70 family sugar kinase
MRAPTPTSRHPRKASRDDGRRWNLLTALQTIAARGTMSRADIARATGLTRATVSSLVTELIGQGLVQEVGTGEAEAGGKPPTLLAIHDGGRQIIALDLSHQPFRAALMDLGGAVTQILTAGSSAVGPAALEVAGDLVARCLDLASAPVLGVGVGTPGMIDRDGAISEAAHLEWKDVPLRRYLADRFDVPVTVGNDAHVAALAELRASDGSETFLLVAVGEGIGAGLVLDGVVHTGEHLSSGEIGHVVVEPDGAACRCGLRGCLETVAAIPSIDRTSAGALDVDSSHRAGRRLGATLAVVISAIDVDRIVIASELTSVDGYVGAIAEELTARMHVSRRPHILVEASSIEGLVLAGAAAAVMRDELGVLLR